MASAQPLWQKWACVMTGLYPTLVGMQNVVLPAAYEQVPAFKEQPSSVKLFVSVSATVAIMVSTAVPTSTRLLKSINFNPAAIASLHAGMVGATGLAVGDYTTADIHRQME